MKYHFCNQRRRETPTVKRQGKKGEGKKEKESRGDSPREDLDDFLVTTLDGAGE